MKRQDGQTDRQTVVSRPTVAGTDGRFHRTTHSLRDIAAVSALHRVSVQKLFCPNFVEFPQTFLQDSFWHGDGREARIVCGAFVFRVAQFASVQQRMISCSAPRRTRGDRVVKDDSG